ncbi:hypothetical protein RD792_001158 [Penstemon davidsonii]|uniref:F-box domain-containing protein n=1 Tax=Penstemon davidsonii TaxID=160366 RepID=A0ABR0DNN0_9LAMI|nr:hypothetical protein RD792_001158 [Penstemon davidsonii]
MGKMSQKDRQSKNGRQKKRLTNAKNKYLKPGALAQIRDSKASLASKSCTDIGKKRIAVLNAKQPGTDDVEILHNRIADESPTILSPLRFEFGTATGITDLFNQTMLQKTPKTPRAEECESESRLESLPSDLLVKILCHLHHDQLRAVFHVSQKVRKAVIIARQFHFNYTTPDRTRQEMLNTMTPLPTDRWPFARRGGKGLLIPSPHTPKAPKHGPRPPSRLKFTDMRQIAAVLFPESSYSPKCLVPSVLPKPICKPLASNRVLFYEDELCKAVAQNKLR